MSGKSLLVQSLAVQREAILELCDALDDSTRRKPLGDGQWSAHELVGHLTSSEGDTLEQLTQTFKEGRPRPMPPELSVDELNRREVAKRKDWQWARVRAEFVHTRNALIQRVDGMSESDLEFHVPSPWTHDTRIISLETLIREDVLGHGAEHLEELKRWRQNHD